MILFFALLFFAVAIAGFCAFVIFWPLTLVHVRAIPDPSLSGLATPARISLCVILFGLAMAGLLALWAEAFA